MAQPAWVYKRDGRLVPFESDRISQALFAASRSLGRPDAFLAREMADGVLHFLDADGGAGITTTAELTELVAKVVRELGQPALARAFAHREGRAPPASGWAEPGDVRFLSGLWQTLDGQGATRDAAAINRRAGDAVLREYSLRRVFAEDVAAAHAEGLLTIRGLAQPFQMAGIVASAAPGVSVGAAVHQAAERAAGVIAVDGLDYTLGGAVPLSAGAAESAVAELRSAARHVGAVVALNLNSADPPAWAAALGAGPLFDSDGGQTPGPAADALAAAAFAGDPSDVEVHWHVSADEFRGPAAARTLTVVRAALQGAPVCFAVDRPGHPVALSEGLDRVRPLMLLEVEVNLLGLVDRLGGGEDAGRFVDRLASVARLARAAGSQKREFLRKRGAGRAAGPLEIARAPLAVVPGGLAEAVARFDAGGLVSDSGLELAVSILRRLRQVLDEEARHQFLEALVFCRDIRCLPTPAPATGRPDLAVVSAAARMIGPANGGTLVVDSGAPALQTPKGALSVLRAASRQSTVRHVRFGPQRSLTRQMVADWSG